MFPATRHSRFVRMLPGILLLSAGGDAGGTDLATRSRRAFEESHYTEAEAAARRRLVQIEAATGLKSPQTAAALDLLVRCLPYGPNARKPESLDLAQRAVDLKRELYGSEDPRLAISMTWRAALLEVNGARREAREQYQLALRITEQTRGSDDAQVAIILSESTPLLLSFGEVQLALEADNRALRILDSAASPDSLQLSFTLNHLAIGFSMAGDYIRALASLDRAIAIREAVYCNPDHPRVVALLNNRAVLLSHLGDHAMALETLQRILASLRRTLKDKNDLRIGAALLNIAIRISRTGDLEGARARYDDALEIFTRRGGDQHEFVVDCLLGIGVVYHEGGDLELARAYCDKALTICSEALPAAHELTALALQESASLHLERGRLDEARVACLRALSIEESLGADRPRLAETLALLGLIHAAAGDHAAARDVSLRAEAVGRNHLRLMTRGFAEREALLYAETRPGGLDVPLRRLADGIDGETSNQVWDAVIRSRAVVLDVMTARARGAALATDAGTAGLVEKLRDATARFMNLTVRGPVDDPQIHAQLLEATQAERNVLERELAARSHAFRRNLSRERIGLDEVAASLPNQSALVAFVEYVGAGPPVPPPLGRTAWKPRWARGIPHLLALVLAPGSGVTAVSLGPASDIDTLVARWSEEARRGGRDTPARAEATYFACGEPLRRAVWDPLTPHLGTARRIFLVPSGSLHKVSFTALPEAPGRYLIDSGWRFQYLAAERDLVAEDDAYPAGEGLLAVGAVDFAVQPPVSAQVAQASAAATLAAEVPSRGPAFPCTGLDDVLFPRLPHTGVEIDRIAKLWAGGVRDATRIELLTGADATETAFKKAAAGKRVLQVATHGFVLGLEDCTATSSGTRSIIPSAPSDTSPLHPSQRWLSGLVFADVARRHAPAPGEDDGFLTAQECAFLNLQGVEWVVLSACDTGLGRTLNGEGVLGLRRAFQVAGAHTIIMSLWAVSDRATEEWMVDLYQARLVRGSSTLDAVHEASLQRLEERRRHGENSHPFFWGAFVCAGDWQ